MLHRVQWQAAAPVLDSGGPQHAALQMRLDRRSFTRAVPGIAPQRLAHARSGQRIAAHQQPLRTAAAALQVLQESAAAGAVVVLTTCLGSVNAAFGRHGDAEELRCTVGHALLRVAAAEKPDCQFRACTHSTLRATVSSATCALIESQPQGSTDAFSGQYTAGIVALPVLQPEAQGGQSASLPCCSSVMITGGLGGLGKLVGQCMAQVPAQHIFLLGRSGRGDLDMHNLGNACVTLLCCDIASAEEVGPLARVWCWNIFIESRH